MLCRLTADQRSSRLKAAFCHTLDDISDLLRLIFPARDVVQEKEGLSARAGNIVHAHCHCVDPDGIMFVQDHGDLHLCPASVGSGQQDRIFHLLDL